MIELKMEIDVDGLQDIENLRARLGSPNLATAFYNAAMLLTELYWYQDNGYEVRLIKGQDARRFRLPSATILRSPGGPESRAAR